MVFKPNHLGKVKSPLAIDPDLLTAAKIRAAQTHLTLGNVIEQALTDYLQKVRQAEQDKERLHKQEEAKQIEEEIKQATNSNSAVPPPSSVFRYFEDK